MTRWKDRQIARKMDIDNTWLKNVEISRQKDRYLIRKIDKLLDIPG